MNILAIIVAFVLIGGVVFLLRQIYFVYQQKNRIEWLESQDYTVIRIDVPRNNEKSPLAAEQMFASIHGIYSETATYQNHLSFEVVSKDKYIQFYVFIPKNMRDFIEGQIYAQYPTVEIHEVKDYAQSQEIRGMKYAGAELLTTKPDVYPIKLFSDFEVDPISGITSVMSKLNPGEQVWLQIIIRPVGDDWQDKGNQIIDAVKSGKKVGTAGKFESFCSALGRFLRMVAVQAIKPGEETSDQSKPIELPGQVQEALKAVEGKIQKLGFETKIRIVSFSENEVNARVKTQGVAATFKQYNTTNLNGFRITEIKLSDEDFLMDYRGRVFEERGSVFNIGELASLYHFPHKTVETPNIVWSGSKKGEPPANIPLSDNTPQEDLTMIGETTFRNVFRLFGIKKDDRRRHIYIIGKSGVGKSVLMENMAIDDLYQNRGVIVVDPHGEFAEKVLACVPDHRVDDVVVFDPADRSYPVAFNLLENVDDDFKGMVASGFVGIFKKIFGYSWGPRLEHILRNTVLALLDYPNSTMLDIPRMLTESRFRERVVDKVKDPVIREFWVNEFAQYDNKFRNEAVSPILNKVGQFLATATIRNIVGQPQSTLNIREIMDQKKIMVVNLSRGKIGEDNSALLGAMMITKIQLAAMSRADITVDNRYDCYLYIDEFQNFATESFAVILSEARKYHLNLTIANQYITQMPEEVRDAVFGNAGTIISFRVGGADADYLVKEFEPVFDGNDLVNLDKYNIYIKLLIEGVSSPAFSAKTLPPVEKISGNIEKIIELSRNRYTKPRAYVEQKIADRSKHEEEELRAEAEAYKKGGLEALLLKDKRDITKDDSGSKSKRLNEEGSNKKGESYDRNINDDTKDKHREAEKGRSADEEEHQPTKSKEGDQKQKSDRKPRYLKYQNVIGQKIYKEHTARGGVKWYMGEDIDLERCRELGIEVDEKAMKMIDLAKKVGRNSKSDMNKDKGSKIDGNNTKEKEKSKAENNSEKNVLSDKGKINEIKSSQSGGEKNKKNTKINYKQKDDGRKIESKKNDLDNNVEGNSNIEEGETVQL